MARAISVDELPIFSAETVPDPSFDFASGSAFLINKPKGWSSFKVVKFLRKCLDVRKIGHAGTLDPMAVGLLILCCGKGTKTVSAFQEAPKKYIAEMVFGASTPSHDAETSPNERAPFSHLSRKKIQTALEDHFAGQIVQIPPMYSALKRNGTPLYKLARKGKKVKRPPRQIIIYDTEILDCNLPKLKFSVHCSKGTYIRSLAYDLAVELGSLGHLVGLKRTAIGEYSSKDALSVAQLKEIFLD